MQWQLSVEYLALVFFSVNIICIAVFILCILNLWKKLMSDEDRIVYIRTLVQGGRLVLIQIHRYMSLVNVQYRPTMNILIGISGKYLNFLECTSFSLSKSLTGKCCNARNCWDVKEHIKCSPVATSHKWKSKEFSSP